MKRVFSEAKGEGPGRRLEGVRRSAGPREGIRSPANIDPSNIDARPERVNMPSDRGVRDHMRLGALFVAGLKLVYRTGRGEELNEKIESGAQDHEIYKSEKRALDRELNPPSAFGRAPDIDWRAVEMHRDNIKEHYKRVKIWNTSIKYKLVDLINDAVNDIFSEASSSDLDKIINIKTFAELPDLQSLRITNKDEAELLSDIFFRNRAEKATPEEVKNNIFDIVRSFIKLDTERMDDEDTISYIINRLKTLTKTASVNRNELKGSSRPNADPHAGYTRHGVNVKTKKEIQSAIRDGELDKARDLLEPTRPDLAAAVGKSTEAAISIAYITGQPLKESYTFRYDVIVENLLRKYR